MITHFTYLKPIEKVIPVHKLLAKKICRDRKTAENAVLQIWGNNLD